MNTLDPLIQLSANLDQRSPDTVSRLKKADGHPYGAFLEMTGIELVGVAVLAAERQYGNRLPFDEALITRALSLCGHREPLSCLRAGTRNEERIFTALERFMAHLVRLPKFMHGSLLEAYLLPYANGCTKFPSPYRERIATLARLHTNEVMLFDLIRRIDRVLQGFDALRTNKEQLELAVALHEHHQKILALTKIFKGVKQEIYTPELCASVQEILDRHPA
jgi:hypothetical protein